jgi:uncharacterized membrane protein YoaK (UPF0700 family)
MFRHKGKTRTYRHNLRLAALLSFIAGLVNIVGVLHLKVLTTNVTGHFAFFAEELMRKNYVLAFNFLLFIFSFLSGAFVASVITEYFAKRGNKSAHKYSMSVEIIILFIIGSVGDYFLNTDHIYVIIGCILLFAMGIQNSLVTQISNSTVRTTHLTGLFTDLGIELSQLFFYKREEQQHKLKKSIELRIAIITCFFLGCVVGGFLYSVLSFAVLIIASALLFVALSYDVLLFNYYKIKRRKVKIM